MQTYSNGGLSTNWANRRLITAYAAILELVGLLFIARGWSNEQCCCFDRPSNVVDNTSCNKAKTKTKGQHVAMRLWLAVLLRHVISYFRATYCSRYSGPFHSVMITTYHTGHKVIRAHNDQNRDIILIKKFSC